MSTLKDVSQTIRQDDWSITVDLKDAFLHIPIHSEYRRFLRSAYGHNKAIEGGMPSKGNTCHLLPGRHSGIGRLIQTSVSPQRRIVVTSPPSGLQEESNKVQTYPHSGFSLLGTRVGHQE